MLPFTTREYIRPHVKLSSVGQQNILVYKLLVSSDKKTFFVNQIPVVRCPGTTALKETEQILTNRRSQTEKGIRCPVSTCIYSEAKDRNPNKRSNLGVHNCILSSHYRG